MGMVSGVMAVLLSVPGSGRDLTTMTDEQAADRQIAHNIWVWDAASGPSWLTCRPC